MNLLRAAAAPYEALVDAGQRSAGGAGGAEAVQAQYDAARDLEETLRAAEPVSIRCRPLLRALRRAASAHLLQVEGFDRPWPPLTRSGLRLARRATGDVDRARPSCRPGRARAPARVPEPETPKSGEVFFGFVRARAPARAVAAEIELGGRTFVASASGGLLLWSPGRGDVPSGVHDLHVTYRSSTRRPVGRVEARRVWLLPPIALTPSPRPTVDVALSARLRALARGFDGYSAIWVHDVVTGRTAAWNADARFPAASLVKLGVLVAALARYGPRPERSAAAYDLRAIAGWSSNAAANRLLRKVGGPTVVERALRRLGATSSTYTGDYRLGTGRLRAWDAPNPPPLVSARVTTARDMGRVLFHLHAGALGGVESLRRLGLSLHAARVALGLLLSWQAPPPGDNAGVLAPAVHDAVPLAQKNGWFSAVRHTAAIVYGPRSPQIVVLLTYRRGLARQDAAGLGTRLARLLGLPS